MINLSFVYIVSAVLQVFLIGAAGFFLFRKNIIDHKGLDLLAWLLVNLFMPCFIFTNLTSQVNFIKTNGWYVFTLIGFAIVLIGIAISGLIFFLNPRIKEKHEFTALVSFQNSGYIPLILVANLFEGSLAQGLFVGIFLLLIAFDISLWSLGVALVTKKKLKDVNLRSLINPPIITLVFTLSVIFFGLDNFIPQIIVKPVKLLGGCVLPMAMLVIGGNLAAIKLGQIKSDMVWAVICKLIVFPLLALGVIWVFKPNFLISFIIMLEAAMPSAVHLSLLSRYFKTEDEIINSGVFYSHIFSVFTVPVFLVILSKMMGMG
ncbi:MAG: AEC family transporter [Candidatus Omnitrophica bacterium]|nr:AEC family transporter [Candidatus Omnitrophota bacterium]